jgi:hypothetical protein
MVPFVADDIPIHHGTLCNGCAVGIRHRVARVIEIGAANGDYGAKDNADKDTHDENSSFPRTSNAADDREFPLVREGPASNYDSQGGAFWVARR